MTKCLTIGLSSFHVAIVTRAAADVASDGIHQTPKTNRNDEWYCDDNRMKPFDDNYVPGAPKEGRAWM